MVAQATREDPSKKEEEMKEEARPEKLRGRVMLF
jgi:hypothetical protein